ncbi:MAG: UDP-N-acetylglucosamine diphosphorylase/glucosamine-1-phosphate N-acetyltransferase [Betaproteobacteria bacterium TMED82]|nr:MAG: UDP-N-acetylglucosamine diphosphorylase/glucosamine-1-phosphate N-acetyltransferase [Betaproteobacteria bacterium TMED82]|tara:strand:+ start:44709 stop:46103 length:1395 start_codon:yes stop_codon:yes gene_type:complete
MNIVILAAGMGKRMNSPTPKVLHKIAGKSMLFRILETVKRLRPTSIFVVKNPHHKEVEKTIIQECTKSGFNIPLRFINQSKALGTGHAVKVASKFLNSEVSTLILFADVPLVKYETLKDMKVKNRKSGLKLLTAKLEDSFGYGRIIRDYNNEVKAIVEEKDADKQIKNISEIFVGPMFVDTKWLKKSILKIDNANNQKEYYLTQLVGLANNENMIIKTIEVSDRSEILGINTIRQKLNVERIFQKRQAESLIEKGVEIFDPDRFDLRGDIKYREGVKIDIGAVLIGDIILGKNVNIGPYCIIENSTIGDDVIIEAFCHIENSVVGQCSVLGPYARLRVGTTIGKNCKVGNFVEIKNTSFESESKANHLSYLGDAKIGNKVNIGAGTITCNYDGKTKHLTYIEDNVFVGSNTELIAPLTLKTGSTIAAGSSITDDVPGNALGIARSKQLSIKNWKHSKARPKKRK